MTSSFIFAIKPPSSISEDRREEFVDETTPFTNLGKGGLPIERLSKESFRDIYTKVPRLCVDVLIARATGWVLTRRDIDPGKGKWHIPGGTVLWKETLLDAASRIALTETGVEIEVVRIAGVIEYAMGKDAFGQSVSIVLLSRSTAGKMRGSAEGKEISAFSTNNLPEPIIDEVADFLRKLQ